MARRPEARQTAPPDDVAWDRIHYRFTYSDANAPAVESTDSISQILRSPVLHILGQSTYLSGGPAAVRVIVTDNRNHPIAGPATLRIDLDPTHARGSLFTGRLDAKGTADAQFHFPAALTGDYPVRYSVETPIGAAEFTQNVRLEDKVAILLTTEKPIYQPGQTIHVRALARTAPITKPLPAAPSASKSGFSRQQGLPQIRSNQRLRHRLR